MNKENLEQIEKHTKKTSEKVAGDIIALIMSYVDGSITKRRFKRDWKKMGDRTMFIFDALKIMLTKEAKNENIQT